MLYIFWVFYLMLLLLIEFFWNFLMLFFKVLVDDNDIFEIWIDIWICKVKWDMDYKIEF